LDCSVDWAYKVVHDTNVIGSLLGGHGLMGYYSVTHCISGYYSMPRIRLVVSI
jgi:hypothetical protein